MALAVDYVRAGFFTVLLLFCTRFVFNTTTYHGLLLRAGKYFWYCDDSSDNEAFQVLNDPRGFEYCPYQLKMIQNLYVIACTTETIGAFVAGFGTKYVGLRSLSLIGLVIFTAFMISTAVSTANFDMLSFGAVCAGLGINLVAFPAFILDDYFPGSEATCAALVIGAQAAASSPPQILEAIWNAMPNLTFQQLSYGYCAVLVLPLFVLTYALVPATRADALLEIADRRDRGEDSVKLLPEVEKTISEERANRGSQSSKKSRRSSVSEQMQQIGLEQGFLVQTIFSLKFAVLYVVVLILTTVVSYYPAAYDLLSTIEARNFMATALVLRVLFGFGWGKLCQKLKTPATAIIQLVLFALLFLLTVALAHTGWLQYATAMGYVILSSFTYALKPMFITEMYPKEYRDRLTGFVSALLATMIGPLHLMNTYGTPKFWCLFVPAVCIATIPPVLVIWHWNRQAHIKVE